MNFCPKAFWYKEFWSIKRGLFKLFLTLEEIHESIDTIITEIWETRRFQPAASFNFNSKDYSSESHPAVLYNIILDLQYENGELFPSRFHIFFFFDRWDGRGRLERGGGGVEKNLHKR